MPRRYYDWSEFSTPEESMDLLSNSIREGLDYDSYGDKRTFKAIVLTPTVQLTNTEARSYGAAFKTEVTSRGRKYKFKARIVEENSPHSFIPNPCSLARNDSTKESAVNPESLVAMHTDVIMMVDGHIAAPTAGDIVEIELKKGDFSYDLNTARFVQTVARNAGEFSILNEHGCQTIARNFDTLNEYYDEGIPLPPGVGGGRGSAHNRRDLASLHPVMAGLVSDLMSRMADRGFTSKVITTWRSPQSQLQKKLEGKSQTAFGYHNFVDSSGAAASQAADLVDAKALYGPDNPSDDPKKHARAAEYFKALGEEAQKLGLRWGGNYSRTNPLWARHGMGWDPAHVELTGRPGQTLASAKQVARNLKVTA